jgi:hypothetical protein
LIELLAMLSHKIEESPLSEFFNFSFLSKPASMSSSDSYLDKKVGQVHTFLKLKGPFKYSNTM